MNSDDKSLLNVPITDAERRHQSPKRSDNARPLTTPTSQPLLHARDRQFTPQIGRFSSLRHPSERYDDSEYTQAYSGPTTKSSTLPGIEEESTYSDHDDEEPIIQHERSTPFSRTAQTQYKAVPNLKPREGAKPYGEPPKFWQPIWLRKATLILIVVVLLLLVICLVVISTDLEHSKGYHVSPGTSHYAWKYTPTLLSLIVVAIISRIDFWTKTLMPWKALALGPESPHETVLVDYISEFQIVSLIAAFKRIHVPVIATVTAYVFSLGLAIASTGLFFTQPRRLSDQFPTARVQSFDISALDTSIISPGTFPNTSVYTYVQEIGGTPAANLGFNAQFAYTLPRLRSASIAIPKNATFTATVDTFIPLISCRVANVTVVGEAGIETVNFPYNSTEQRYGSPSNLTLRINENEICGSWPELTFLGLDPLHYVVPKRTLESRSAEIRCNGSSNVDPIVLLSMIQVDYTQTLLKNVTRQEGGRLPIALNTSRNVTRLVNVLCQAGHTLSQTNVTNNTALDGIAAITFTALPRASNRTLQGLTNSTMTSIFNALLGSNTGIFVDSVDNNFIRTPAFDLLSWTIGTGKYDDLFNAENVINAAKSIYHGTMPQFASKNLISRQSYDQAPNGVVASITWTEERLFTNWTAVIIALICLGFMILLLVALLILLPADVVPRDPNSIASQATFLSRSFELNRLLKKLHSPNNKGIAAALNGYDFGTAIAFDEDTGSRAFKIHVTEGKPQRGVQDIVPNSRFWNPVWISLPVGALTFLIPLILLALLEIFQHRSDTNRGLWNVPDDRGTMMASHFIPAFITLLVAALINNLDFYIALFSPWAALKKANATPDRSILTNVLGHSALRAIIVASKSFQWGAVCAAIATVMGTFLTVFISGLYVVDDFPLPGPTRAISRLDNFELDRLSNYTVNFDNGAGAAFDLIQHNYSYPDGTFQENVFPRIQLQDFQSNLQPGSQLVGDMQGTLPGYRGNISCDYPDVSLSQQGSSLRVSATYQLPQACSSGINSLNSSVFGFSMDFAPTTFGGRMMDLRFGTNSSRFGHLGEANSSLVGNNPAVGCPSLLFVWGKFGMDVAPRSTGQGNVNVAICYQRIQEVNVNVTLQQGTTYFTRSPGYMSQNSSATTYPNPNGTTDVFDFRIQRNLERQLGDFAGRDPNIDPFFQVLLKGSIPVDINRFLSDRSMAMMLISHTYRVYMAQVISLMARQPISNANSPFTRQSSNLQPLRTTALTSRLVQDQTSKIILQVLLALSAVLILIGYVITKMRNVLPCNPCSIAGTMSLLAGSNLIYAPDAGLCECCGKLRRSLRSADGRPPTETIHADENEHEDESVQLIRSGAEWMDKTTFARVFAGQTYSLGWWEGKVKRYGVDYKGILSHETDEEWYLGKKRNSGSFATFAEGDAEQGRGRTRALSDVNERGTYQRAPERSPNIETHELREMTGRPTGREGQFGTG